MILPEGLFFGEKRPFGVQTGQLDGDDANWLSKKVRRYFLSLVPILSIAFFTKANGEGLVEPELQVTFDAALKKLPQPLLKQVGDVVLTRAEDLGIGDEHSLENRLLSRAAFASLSVMTRNLTVYDAGVWRLMGGKVSMEQLMVHE